MSRGRVRDIDRGAKRVTRAIGKASRERGVTIGIHEGDGAQKHDGEAATIVEIGAYHEFGGPEGKPPRRSFIRDWADENEAKHREFMNKLALGIIKGTVNGQEHAAQLFGVRAVADVQKRMSQGIPPALAESTIQRKGSSIPLIDTGQLRSSITYKVEH